MSACATQGSHNIIAFAWVVGKLTNLNAVIECSYQTKIALYVISAAQLCITKMSTPESRGDKTQGASPPLQKVGGTCPPVHPRIYAHEPSHETSGIVRRPN